MSDFFKLRNNFILEKIEGKITLFDVEESTFYSFNKTGTHILELIKKKYDQSQIIESIEKKFAVTKEKAIKDLDDFLKTLSKSGIISPLKQKPRRKLSRD